MRLTRMCTWSTLLGVTPLGRLSSYARGGVRGEDFDARLRMSAMAWLRTELLRTPEGIRHDTLTEFRFEGTRIPLLNLQRGIWKPAVLDAALSIRTVYRNRADERPYDDAPGAEGLLRYKWMGFDPSASDNRAVRRAMDLRLPLIYLVGIARGVYQPVFPAYVEAEERDRQQFVVSTSAEEETAWRYAAQGQPELAREYLESVRHHRLHQRVFREQVLLAYEGRCALCHLGHRELIDAAHIREDAAGERRRSPTASPCASCITRPSTTCWWVCRPTTGSTSATTCSRRWTARRCSTRSSSSTAS